MKKRKISFILVIPYLLFFIFISLSDSFNLSDSMTLNILKEFFSNFYLFFTVIISVTLSILISFILHSYLIPKFLPNFFNERTEKFLYRLLPQNFSISYIFLFLFLI